MPSPKQYNKRPKNPPRPSSLQTFSTDSAASFRSSIPVAPGSAAATPPPAGVAGAQFRPSTPTNSSDSPPSPRTSPTATGSSRSRTSFRKPVPTFDSQGEAPSPKTIPSAASSTIKAKPRLTNPNPFAVPAVSTIPESDNSSNNNNNTPTSHGKPAAIEISSAGRKSPDELSPTSAAPFERKASPDKSPLPSPTLHSPSADDEGDDEFATLNFNRRPSQFDPIAPSFHHHAGGPLVPSSSGSRSLVPKSISTKPVPGIPAPGPSPTDRSGLHHRKTSSGHVRQQSISLSSPFPSTQASPVAGSPRSLLPSHAQHPDSRKILPLQPAATSAIPSRTRAPLDTFASVEMLQGQREASDKKRGTEVFGPAGYEGRAHSIHENSGLPAYSRHQDHLSNLHAARNPALAQQHPSTLPGGGLGPAIPPLVHDFDPASIASQLREHDLRRGSEDARGEWSRRFSGSSSDDALSPKTADFGGMSVPTMDIGGASLNPQFSFPARPGSSTSSFPSYAYDSHNQDQKELLTSAFDDDDVQKKITKKSKLFKSFGGSNKQQQETMASVWATENLGPTSHPFSLAPRPSIVALPVYPPTSANSANSVTGKFKKAGAKVSILTALLSTAATGVYLAFRYQQLLSVERKMPNVFVGGWAFLALETIVAAMISIHTIFTVFTYKPKGSAPKLRLRGDQNLPSVDVFIVSSGQADQTVFDCAVAAASMDYPAHRFRVMVLDPTCSSSLSTSLAKHAASQACPHLSYHRRELNVSPLSSRDEKSASKKQLLLSPNAAHPPKEKKDRFDNKANSINFGMQEASTFGMKGPADYIAVFDADMIPERNYLRAVLPSILRDDKVALVKTRHGFINLPHKLNQPTGTMMNAAETDADTRSGFLLRRNALNKIGGFPADSWIHDGQAEALLLGRGYRVAQVEEVLQWGMAKPTYTAQVNFMSVNRLGPLRTASRLGWFLSGDKVKLMPWSARIKAIGKALLPIFSLLVVLLAYVYPFMFSFGGILVLTPNLRELNKLLQATLVMIVLQRLHELVWAWSTGLHSPRRAFQSWIFSAPYNAFAILRLILPRQLGGYARGTDLDINETIAVPQRQVWWKRLIWFACDPHAGTMFAFCAAVGVAIWRIVKDYERGTVDSHQTALTVLLTVAWPSLLWLEFVFAAFVPFVCLLFPSRLLTEPRESFLIRDHYSSVARPKHHFKTAPPFKVYRAPEFIVGVFIVAWATVCVCVGELTDVLA
ncbi:uncharacterized protein JCM15063_006051 [Sporobolomyces koalae]|uniref:uncharacterized protein n=1 Tax=Sporobolomyces koalae TaxID=500713 RepID=UPI00316C46B2